MYICNIIKKLLSGKPMNKQSFRNMTLGKTLWAVILIKLFIIFVVLKLFFFPDFLSTHAEKGGEADYVATKTLNIKD